jgi:CRISPR-associated protein Csb2
VSSLATAGTWDTASHAGARCVRAVARGAASPPGSVFGEWLVMREAVPPGGRGLGLDLSTAEDVTRALRGAILHHADDPPPAVLSGHEPDGRRSERSHAAFLALPHVGPDGGVGGVAGAAFLLPREIEPADRLALLLAAHRFEQSGFRLTLGRLGAMRLARWEDPLAVDGRGVSPWNGPARRWASVTPVALDRNPGDLTARDPAVAARAARDAEAIVARGCGHVGLPPPSQVRIRRRSLFLGAPPAPAFMPFPRHGSGFKRVCVHVDLEFPQPVEGPVLLGVGRYFGVGWCWAVG